MPTGAVMVPGDLPGALAMLDGALGFPADMDAAGTPAAVLAIGLRALERADAVGAAARGRMLAAFDVQDGSVADGQRTTRTWLVHSTRVTRGQAAEHKAVQALAEGHRVLLAGLREGGVVTKSIALQLARWTAVRVAGPPAEQRADLPQVQRQQLEHSLRRDEVLQQVKAG
jgi:hypothetical protein